MILPERPNCASDSGAAALEFAILAPVCLMLMTGILAYGIYFGAAHSVQQLAADAARTSVAGLDNAERGRLVASFLNRNADGYVLIDRAGLSFEVGAKPNDPDEYVVTLHYDASALPIWDLYPPLPLPASTISFTSAIRRGGI